MNESLHEEGLVSTLQYILESSFLSQSHWYCKLDSEKTNKQNTWKTSKCKKKYKINHNKDKLVVANKT